MNYSGTPGTGVFLPRGTFRVLPAPRKHFPTKEALFRDCTQTFGETLTMPNLASLGGITEPARRCERSVSELCRIHEALFGYAWHSAHRRKGSPSLDAEMSRYDGLADAIAEIIAPAGSRKAPVARGLLDFLTYRALRLSGGALTRGGPGGTDRNPSPAHSGGQQFTCSLINKKG